MKSHPLGGGIVAVSTLSTEDVVARHYAEGIAADKENCDKATPSHIFGWDLGRDKRKPNTHALDVIIEKYGVGPKEILVVDDNLLGIEMGNKKGTYTAGVGYSHSCSEITEVLKK
eukprot:Trichotokara_eunicae@DN5487_c0_g2_i1.p1